MVLRPEGTGSTVMSEVFVRVAVRIRPLLPKEKLHKHQKCVRLVPGSTRVLFGSDRLFSFDHTFGPTSNQDEVYQSCVRPLVEHVITGYNATIFCYGQTGSGKTYTMEGGPVDEEGGIIDRVAQDVFSLLEEKKTQNEDMETTVWVTYMELYREELRDLLEQQSIHKVFHIREDEKGNTVVMGAKEIMINSAEELLSVLQTGKTLRQIAITGMNERSSRSHTIITLKVAQCCPNDKSTRKSVRTSKLRLIDLAGSERAGKTGNTGLRLKESVHINTGLLALSKVISALSNPARSGHSMHIPYRDAKITRLLRDALGGTSHTLMVVCVSPSHHSADETLGALHFASKARHIRNSPKATCTEVKSCIVARLAELEFEVQTLRELLKEKEVEAETARLLALDAAALLEEMCHSSLSGSFRERLQDWQERLAVVNHTGQTREEEGQGQGGAHEHETALKLREELNRCQEALLRTEQLLEQKEAELRQVQTEAGRSFPKSRGFGSERERRGLQTERGGQRPGSDGGGASEDASVKRPCSEPATPRLSGDRALRKVQSCPAVLQRVSPAPRGPQTPEKDHADSNTFTGFLNQTWQKNRNPLAQRIRTTGTKENHVRLRPNAGQRKIHDLSINIRMKEELLSELDRTDLMLQAVNGHDVDIITELSEQNQETRKEVFLTLQQMKVEREELQKNLQLQRPTTDQQDPGQSQVCEGSWLEQQEEQLLQRREELQELQKEVRSREEVLRRREACLQEKYKLERKMIHSSEALSQDLLCVSQQLKSVEEHLHGNSQGPEVTEELQREREALKRRREALDSQLKDNRVLTAEEEYQLLQLEESIEALNGALDFKNRVIHDKQKKLMVSQPARVCDVIRKLKELEPPEASELLIKYFNKVVCLRENERHLRLHGEELELHVGELEASLGDMEAAMQRLALEADRRFTKQSQDYQRNLERLSVKLQEENSRQQEPEVQDRMQHLEKEVFYYKSYTRKLKRMLQGQSTVGAPKPEEPTSHEPEPRPVPHNPDTGRKKTQIHTELTERKTNNISLKKRLLHQTPCPTSSDPHKKLSDHEVQTQVQSQVHTQVHSQLQTQVLTQVQTQVQSQIQTRSLDGTVREAGQHLEVAPLRLSRRKVRQISRPEARVSASATRGQQSEEKNSRGHQSEEKNSRGQQSEEKNSRDS